jgi:hypothetical protein
MATPSSQASPSPAVPNNHVSMKANQPRGQQTNVEADLPLSDASREGMIVFLTGIGFFKPGVVEVTRKK